MTYKYCWGCPHSTMDYNGSAEIFFRCDLRHMRVAYVAVSSRLLRFGQTPEWCPINEEEKQKILFLLCISGPTNPMELLGDAANV